MLLATVPEGEVTLNGVLTSGKFLDLVSAWEVGVRGIETRTKPSFVCLQSWMKCRRFPPLVFRTMRLIEDFHFEETFFKQEKQKDVENFFNSCSFRFSVQETVFQSFRVTSLVILSCPVGL